MNSRSASIVGDREAGGSSSFAWCNRQWLWSQALTWRSSTRLKLTVFDHNLLWLPESNGYPHHLNWWGCTPLELISTGGLAWTFNFLVSSFQVSLEDQRGFFLAGGEPLFCSR